MYEPSSSRDLREQQGSPQAGTDTQGSMFANASNFTLVNSKFQAATTIINHPTGGTEPIRKWLKAPDPSTNFVAACDKRTPGTGDWIFAHPEFVKWSQGTPGLLWIQGKVGSGKTFLSYAYNIDMIFLNFIYLMTFFRAAIVQKLKADPGLLCCYYYFDNRDNSQIKTNARGLLKSLLLQMATRNEGIHHALQELYVKCKQGLLEPTIAELSATLASVFKDLSPVYLVLDAMDECDKAMDVFKYLAHLRENLYMAVTSRYLAEASYGATESIHLEVDFARSGFDQDIAQYIQEKLSYRKLNPELFTEIVGYLTQGARGQFRWVDCQVTVLQRCVTPKAIKDALDKLPKTLEGTYTVAIERLKKSEHLHDGVQLLMWLAYAFRPLSIEEVTDILAVDLDAQIFDPAARSLELETGIYSILDSTLITVDAKKIVQLAHNSVKEYLTQIKGQSQLSELIEINEHLANSTICQACLIYLLHLDSQGILPKYKQGLRELYPLALYASKGWPSHMKRLDEAVPEHKPAKDLAITFLKDSSQPAYMNWIRIHNMDQECSWERYNPTLGASEIQTPLYYMACLGLLSIAKHLLVENMADVNAKGGRYGTALMAAIRWENKDIIQLLLEHKADVNVQGGEYGSALQAAASEGNKDLVQLLLKYKADINALGRPYGTALQAAIFEENQDVVQLLLKHKADVNVQGGEYGSALQAASWRGNNCMVQLLLEHNAEVNAQGGWYGSALQAAASEGNKDIVQLLLWHQADVNIQGGRFGTALQTAVIRENKDIVQLLLEHKADVNSQGGKYGNALLAAINRGNKNIVQLVLEHKADINVQGGVHGSALLASISQGDKDIVQLLLEHKPNINIQGKNALLAAISTENSNIVQLVLEHKADVNVQGGEYGSALHAAAYSGNKNVVQLLLEHNADVNIQGGKFGSILQAAALWGHQHIIQLLLEYNADVNAPGGEYGSTLQAASWWGNKFMVRLLLEHKADVNAQGGKYGNALLAAISRGNKNIVQLLLEHKADVNMQGGKFGSALQTAVVKANKDIVKILLEHKADVNAQGGKYGNALQAAARRGNQHIVQLLLEYKADVNAPGGEYGSALQAASWRGNKCIVQLLLEHKADVNDQGGKYGTALQAATCWGDQHVVQLLLETNPNAKTQVPRIGNALLTAISNAQYMNLNEVDFLKIFDMGNVRSLELCVYEGGVHSQVKNLIHTAIRNRNKDIVQLLLEHNANVNVQGGRYGNALQAAIRKGNKDIVQLLLEYKADVNVQRGEYGGALHVATYRGNKDIVQLLLEHKAEVNVPVERFGSALQIAVIRENKDIVQLLLEHKADVNAQGGKYGNALQAAARWGNLHIVQLLLEHKADVNAQGGWYGNALCAAVSGQNNDILQLLLTHQAKNAHRACETALQLAVNVEHIVQISDS